MERSIEVLAAKQEISDVLSTYCRALDRMDEDLARSVWHGDGTADYPGLYRGSARGFLEWVWNAHGDLTGHSHQVSNALIEVDGDGAVSECYVTAVLEYEATNGTLAHRIVRGRYLDRWARRHGRWAIVHRRFVPDLQPEVISIERRGTTVDSGHGTRDRDDPSYEFL